MKRTLVIFGWFCLIFIFFAMTQILPVKANYILYIPVFLIFGLSFILSMILLAKGIKSAVNFLLVGGLTLLGFGALFDVPYFFIMSVIYFVGLIAFYIFQMKQ